MLISGMWRVDADGMTRPYPRCAVRSEDGNWQELFFLIDSGADRTVLTSQAFQELGYQAPAESLSLSGLGGLSAMIEVDTALRLFREDDSAIVLNGTYAAAVSPTGLDTCVMGRDVLNMFTLIIDRAENRVLLLRAPHRFSIELP